MALCGSCGADNPAGFKFCGSCGTALGAPGCPSCGFTNPDGQRFCGNCGAPLSGDAVAPTRAAPSAGERKLATVLFADVVGFTTLAENTDPEAVARTVDTAFRRMAEVVESYGGTVDKYLGDALMAVFGVPQAHDDDAERAVAAALAMRELGGDLAFSIGINTGEVMATAVGRDGDVTVIGDAVNVAARLEKAATGGEVLVGALTAELAGGVKFRERQPVLLKGKRDPVPVWEAVALRPDEAPVAAPERLPLVGRDDELAFLRSHWRRVTRDRRSAVVLLAGEAGLGKTRLLEELAAEVADEALVARTRYPAYGGLGGPKIAADIGMQLGPAGDEEVDVRVKSVSGDLDPSLRAMDPAAMEQEQLWAYRRYFETKAEERPLLVVIDDIHRSGDQTLSLLGELMARVVDVPVLLVLAGRPDPGEWLARFPSATTVRLTPLSAADGAALIAALMPDGDADADDDRVAILAARGAGNPLYLRELVAVVGSGGADTMPPTLQAILAARLDALRPEEKGALQRVSVLGDAATEEQVAALGLTAATSALSSLVAAGLLRERADACYEVVDPLLREVGYETLPRQVRGEWHRQAAQVAADGIEQARHLERAAAYLPGDAELQQQAAATMATAGLGLLDAYRVNDGVALLQRAVDHGAREAQLLLRLAQTLANMGREDEAEKTLAYLDDLELTPAQEAERAHVEALSHMFNTPEGVLDALADAARRWAEVGDRAKQGWAWSNRGVALFNSGQMAEAADNLERAIGLFAEAGEYHGKTAAQSFLALIRPDDPRVQEWLEDALARAEDLGDRSSQCNALILLSWHHALRCHLGTKAEISVAEGYADRARALAHDLHFAEFEIHGLCLRSIFSRLAGHVDEARTLAEQAARVPSTPSTGAAILVQGVRYLAASAADPTLPAPDFPASQEPVGWMGWLAQIEGLILAGHPDQAVAVMEGAEDLPTMGPLDGMTRDLVFGLALVQLGRHGDAAPSLKRAAASARAVRSSSGAQAASALLAEVAARTGEGDAPRLLEQAGSPTDGIAAALVHRARAAAGDAAAAAQVAHMAEDLAAPGLLLGTDGR